MNPAITVTLTDTAWSGWVPGGHSISNSAQVRAAKGAVLSHETLRKGGSDVSNKDGMAYEVAVQDISADRAAFAFRGLVIDNPDGTINLTAKSSGQFILRPGEIKHLSTPTMDAGIKVTVRLDEIHRTGSAAQATALENTI